MKRREALSSISVLTGASLILPQIVLTGCERPPHPYSLFTWGDTEILDEISEIILPESVDVPGAKAARVGDFIQSYVSECLPLEQKDAFLYGYREFKKQVDANYGDPFDELDPDDRVEIIKDLELQKEKLVTTPEGLEYPHFYGILKGLANFGYFTSEIGATKALRYLPIPGSQKGEIPYEGERAWAL